MKLRTKILMPIITILSVSIIILGVYGYGQAKKIALMMRDIQLKNTTSTISETMEERLAVMEITLKAMDEKNIMIAKSVAETIKANPRILRTENMVKLAKEIGVDEIHVTNEKGVLLYGNMEGFYGFDFTTSDQTKPFMKIIEEKDYILAQEPTERGADKQLFQYIGVSRIDKPGIVQIGVTPKIIRDLMGKMDLQGLVERVHMGEEGYVAILDKKGIILAHPIKKYVGVDITQYDWGKEILGNDQGNAEYEWDGMNQYVEYKRMKDHIVMAAYPTSEYMDYINRVKKSMGIILIASIVLSILAIFIFIRRQVTMPLARLVNGMEKAGNGDLTINLESKSQDEIGQLSNSFNKMMEQMKTLVGTVLEISMRSKNTSEMITNSADEIGASSSDIAKTIQEIAAGATDQAIQSVEGLNVTNALAQKIENISEQSKITIQNAVDVKEKNEKGIQSMEELKDRFNKNTEASIIVGQGVQQLSVKSKSIGTIVETINAIAEQTNLLALNAAIEAARAGEAGRGFAVVADEVRKLAEGSAVATNEIKQIIKEIIEVITHTETTMEHAGELVEKANDSLEDTSKVFNDIKLSGDGLIHTIELLNKDVNQMNDLKEQVMMAIENISAITQESAASTEEVSAATQEQTATIEEVAASIEELDQTIIELVESVKLFNL